MQIANWVECCKGYETWMNQDTVFFSDRRALGIVGKSSFRAFWECFSRNEWINTEEDIPFSFPYPNLYCSVAWNQFIAASGNQVTWFSAVPVGYCGSYLGFGLCDPFNAA